MQNAMVAKAERELRQAVALDSLETIDLKMQAVKQVGGNCFAPGPDSGATILHRAVQRGNLVILEFVVALEDIALSINQPEKTNEDTPFHWACGQNNNDIIRIFCKYLADPTMKNKQGVTPLQLFANSRGFLADEYHDLTSRFYNPETNWNFLKDERNIADKETQFLLMGLHYKLSLAKQKDLGLTGWQPKTLSWRAGEITYQNRAVQEWALTFTELVDMSNAEIISLLNTRTQQELERLKLYFQRSPQQIQKGLTDTVRLALTLGIPADAVDAQLTAWGNGSARKEIEETRKGLDPKDDEKDDLIIKMETIGKSYIQLNKAKIKLPILLGLINSRLQPASEVPKGFTFTTRL